MSHTHLLWDFNGTIIDDVAVGIASLNALLSRRGLKTMDSVDAYYKIFGFPIIDYYRRAGFDFSVEPFEAVAVEWVKEYEKNFPSVCLRHGVLETFKAVRGLGISQVIISATEQNMLNRQVESFGILGYFDSVNGISDIYASGKVEIAKKWAASTPHNGLLFVGDSVHDFEVANAIGADCVLISGGHQGVDALKTCGCPVICSPLEICGFL